MGSKKLNEAVRMQTTPWYARWIFVSLYRAGASLKSMFNKHKAYLLSDINENDSPWNEKELIRQVDEISSRQGGILLGDHSLLPSS